MAICEIKTARNGDEHQVPQECSDWQDGQATVGRCVEALSRSPQFWSSYSGYLRQVVTLCSSFRQWADIQTAKDQHANSAHLMRDFIGKLRDFETQRATDLNERQVVIKRDLDAMLNLQQALSSVLDALHLQQVTSEEKSTELQDGLRDTFKSLVGMTDRLDSQIERHGSVSNNIAGAVEGLKLSLMKVGQIHEQSLRQHSSDLALNIGDAFSGLLARIDSLETSMDLKRMTLDADSLEHSLLASKLFAQDTQDQQFQYTVRHLQQLSHLSLVLNNVTDAAKSLQHERNDHGGLLSKVSLVDVVWIVSVVSPLFRPATTILKQLTAFKSAWAMFRIVIRLATALVTIFSFVVSAIHSVLLPISWLRKGRIASGGSSIHLSSPPPPLFSQALSSTAFSLSNPPLYTTAGLGSSARPRRAAQPVKL
ncbi:hypothetical protein ACM66B_001637 [Microbotryomycetes sp. NB124-2]